MKKRDVVGKRIVDVAQKRVFSEAYGHNVVVVESITLDDGTVLFPSTYELETDYGTTFGVVKPRKEPKA